MGARSSGTNIEGAGPSTAGPSLDQGLKYLSVPRQQTDLLPDQALGVWYHGHTPNLDLKPLFGPKS